MDSSGTFSVDAEFVGCSDGEVRLRKTDGRSISVPLIRLSDPDQAYVRSVMQPDVDDVLAGPTEFEFVNTPLDEVARFLAEKHRVPVWIERWALMKAGVDVKAPVTAKSSGGSLAATLMSALKSLKLMWTTEGNLIVITTEKEAHWRLYTCVYQPDRPVDLEKLGQEIRTNIVPAMWDVVGGNGSMDVASPPTLVVTHRADVHHEIRRHYAGLLTPIRPSSASPPVGDAGRPTLQQALAQTSHCDFVNTPLDDAVKQLSERHQIHIGIHKLSLQDAGIPSDAPISCALARLPLGSLLTEVLREPGLTWSAKRTGLIVATPKHARIDLERRVYPADDLAGGGDHKELIDVIRRTISPADWDWVGGPGSIRSAPRGILEVEQSYRVHREIEDFLAALRQAKSAK